jgi:tripartite-type tricarboxylate transporter receptor subunit TctC
VVPHGKSERLKSLVVSSAKRSVAVPELPTIAEAGLPGYEATAWHCIRALAGGHQGDRDEIAVNARHEYATPHSLQ